LLWLNDRVADQWSRIDRATYADADVLSLASSVLKAPGDVDCQRLEQLRVLRKRLEQLREVSGWPNVDWPNWHKANHSLWILRQVSNATA